MKQKKLFLLLAMLILTACTQENIEVITTKVDSISVQELDDKEYLKKQEAPGDGKIAEIYKMTNNNFTIVPDKSFNGCTDLENNKVGSYVVKNNMKKISDDKINYSYVIYRVIGDENQSSCKKIKTVKNAKAYHIVEFNNHLYLEVDTFQKAERKQLFMFDGTNLNLVKKNIKSINNMVVFGDNLFLSYGRRLDSISKTGKRTNVKKSPGDKIKSISATENKLYIIFEQKGGKFYVNQYIYNTDKEAETDVVSNMDVFTKELAINFEFSDPEYFKAISPNIIKSDNNNVLFSDKLICKSDYTSCKYVDIEGETILGFVEDFVMYSSDRIYLSNLTDNMKQVMSNSGVPYLGINDKEILFKMYTSNGKSHEYFKYELADK